MRLRASGLTARLAIFAAGLVAATATAVALWLVELDARNTREDLKLRSAAVARGLAARVAAPLEMGDRAAIQQMVESLWNEPDVARVEIGNVAGRQIAAHTFSAAIEGAPPVVVPITLAPDDDGFRTPIGQVRVHLSAQSLGARRDAHTTEAARAAGAVAVIGVLLAGALALALAAPILRLRRSVEKLAAGAYADVEQIPLTGPREVADLGRAFRGAAVAVAERETALREVNAALRRTEEMRDAMTHMLVHDLKGPLSNLIMLLGLLDTAVLDEEDRELLGEGKVRCERLMEMIADLLMVARLESGKVELELERCPVDDLVDEALRSIEVSAAQSGFRIDVQSPESDAATLVCDRRLVERVLQNLLVNALRYGASPIQLIAVVDAETATFVVADAGAGVPADQAERIFEMFGTLSKGKGTGLGLAFVRMAVAAHGGRVEVVGARFTLTLPRHPAVAAEAA
jgi:signal transduction histidine kinase